MAKKTLSIFDKTIAKKFPDWKGFWNQAKQTFINAGLSKTEKDKFNAYFFTWKVYDYWKYNIYWGYQDQFFNKLYSRLAMAFLELQKREALYSNLFKGVKLKADKAVNLTDTTTTTPGTEIKKGTKKGMLTDRRWDNRSEDIAQARAINRNKPRSAIDLIAGEYGFENEADWLQTEMETAYGLRRNDGDKIKFSPNWATGKGHWHDKTNLSDDETIRRGQTKVTVKRQEQPTEAQQISKIVQSFALSETNITEYVVAYFDDLFYNNTIYMPPGADLKWDQTRQGFFYKDRGDIEEEETDEKGKPKKPKTEFDRLSFEAYINLKQAGEAVEDTLDLENLCRERARRIKYPNRDETKQATLMRALNGLITAYTRDLYFPTLEAYDKVMGAITGFKEFKAELRDQTEIAQYYKSIHKKPLQVFYCLLGKPGVGKSEISKTLAKAYRRPFNVLGMAGQAHPKILKGSRPSLTGAKYGRIVESFCDTRANIFITKDQHQATLNKLEAKAKKTANQEEYIAWLKNEIKDIEKQEANEGKLQADLAGANGTGQLIDGNTRPDLAAVETIILKRNIQAKLDKIHGKDYDLPSKGPIILLDEAEKVKDQTVLFIMGQITDRELNYWYEDEFLEYGINLGEAIILLTANYADLVPDFVRSRCKFVNIQLLEYKERLNILQIRRDMMIREYFPAPKFSWENPDAEETAIDAYNKSRSRISPLTATTDYNNSTIYLTDEQQRIKDLMSDRFLELCITETFGIREGIINLVSTFSFLIKAKIRGKIDELPTDLFIDKPTTTDENGNGQRQEQYNGIDHGTRTRIREEINDPDPTKEGSGLINLYFDPIIDGNGDRQALSVIKKRDIEYKKMKKAEDGKAECVLNLIKGWKGYNNYDQNWKPKHQQAF